jgi:hypothetical protein
MRLPEILFTFVCNKISKFFLLYLYIQVKNNFALTLKNIYSELKINLLCQAIYHSLDTSCGRQLLVEPLKGFWTKDMQKANEYREICYRKWRKSQDLNKLKYWLKYQEACAALRRLIQKRHRENWKHLHYQLTSSQYAKAIVKISYIRKRRTISPAFSTMEGIQRYYVSSVSLTFE